MANGFSLQLYTELLLPTHRNTVRVSFNGCFTAVAWASAGGEGEINNVQSPDSRTANGRAFSHDLECVVSIKVHSPLPNKLQGTNASGTIVESEMFTSPFPKKNIF